MTPKNWMSLALVAAVGGSLALSLAATAEEGQQVVKKRITIHADGSHHGGAPGELVFPNADRLVITDSASIGVGSSRDYTTPGGKTFTLRHEDEDSWVLSGEGKEVRFGAGGEVEVEGDGEATTHTIRKQIVVHQGAADGEALGVVSGEGKVIHLETGEGKEIKVIVQKGEGAEPAIVNVTGGGEGQPVKVIMRKSAEGADAEPMTWVTAEGGEGGEARVIKIEGAAAHMLPLAGDATNATVVEIINESNEGGQHNVQKRVFVIVKADAEEN